MKSGSITDHDQQAHDALLSNPPDYNRYSANIAASYHPVRGQRVLLVGCNRGEDCRHFVEFGAASVVGLDVIKEIGANFVHDIVSYPRASAEAMPFHDSEFDLIYSFATMEHVFDIESAFGEMVRVCRPGGLVYSHASSLWNTRHGPHWGNAFDDYPWIHLRLEPARIIAFSEKRHKETPDAQYLSPEQIKYMTDIRFFNKRPCRDYLAICGDLRDVEIIRNDIEEENGNDVDEDVVNMLKAKGYDRRELFGLTHIFIAKKTGGPAVAQIARGDTTLVPVRSRIARVFAAQKSRLGLARTKIARIVSDDNE
jgi:SAM-dependent methyltransferase